MHNEWCIICPLALTRDWLFAFCYMIQAMWVQIKGENDPKWSVMDVKPNLIAWLDSNMQKLHSIPTYRGQIYSLIKITSPKLRMMIQQLRKLHLDEVKPWWASRALLYFHFHQKPNAIKGLPKLIKISSPMMDSNDSHFLLAHLCVGNVWVRLICVKAKFWVS